MQNPANKDLWRDANGADSQHHVQKTQFVEKDILVLSGTEKSVALKHDQSEDPRLKTQVLLNIRRKLDVSSRHMPPANQALWGSSMNSRVWEQQCTSAKTMRTSSAPFRKWKCGTLRRSLERCKRRLAFSNIVIMKSTDLKKQWIGQVVIGEFIRCWIKRLPRNSHHKSKYSVIRFCVLADNVKNILRKQTLGKTIALESSSKAQNISHITITVATKMITGIPFPVFLWGFTISSYRVLVSGLAELVFPLPVTGCASSRN